jgi:hypothetical protein
MSRRNWPTIIEAYLAMKAALRRRNGNESESLANENGISGGQLMKEAYLAES